MESVINFLDSMFLMRLEIDEGKHFVTGLVVHVFLTPSIRVVFPSICCPTDISRDFINKH